MVTKTEQLQGIFRKYRGEKGLSGPTSIKDVCVWAMREELWKPEPAALLTQFTEEMSRALRAEIYTDKRGRRVRANHSRRLPKIDGGEQLVMWDHITTVSRDHMEASVQQRRQGIVSDCHRLKVDVDSFNKFRSPSDPIAIFFDFTEDLVTCPRKLVQS